MAKEQAIQAIDKVIGQLSDEMERISNEIKTLTTAKKALGWRKEPAPQTPQRAPSKKGGRSKKITRDKQAIPRTVEFAKGRAYISPSLVARQFKITEHAAQRRCSRAADLGELERLPVPGRYRIPQK